MPIFHEGMKFWSCCQRKTSDFQSFLNQEGCMLGEHKWKKDDVSLILEGTFKRVRFYALKFQCGVLFIFYGLLCRREVLK